MAMKEIVPAQTYRPLGIIIVAVLMILFGLSEVATGFTHNFLGIISTAKATVSTYGGVGIGSLYAIAGILIFSMKKWAMILAEIFLLIVVVGRISLVLTGLYPTNSFLQTLSIIIGTSIAIVFALYIGLKRKLFK